MKKDQKLWTRDELILAMNLYCKLPFGRLHKTNPEIIHLAKLIGRTPNAVHGSLSTLLALIQVLKPGVLKELQTLQLWTGKSGMSFMNIGMSCLVKVNCYLQILRKRVSRR